MRRLTFALLTLAASAGATLAADDAVSQRRALMKANGDATKPVVAIMKGGAFDLAAVQTALKTYIDAAQKMPGLFPPDSKTGGDTAALPAVWENKADFEARFAKLGADSKSALDSIKDAASFQATMPDVLKNCGGCHETYKAKKG